VLLKTLMRKMSVFERYKNVTAMNGSIMIKLFLAIFINIGVLIVVINADFTSAGIPANISGDYSTTS